MASNTQKHDRTTTLWAVLLIGIGLLSLAANAGWLAWITPWIWAALFVAGGGAFLYYYTLNRRHWWALIPGFTLLGIAAAIVGGEAGGGLFLALIGAGFATIYVLEREKWWAIIPAGALMTLGAVAWLDTMFPAVDVGWVFFLGLAATFGLLYALPEGQGKQRWAMFPALATLALSLMIIASGAVTGIVVPLILIAAGILLMWRRTTTNDHSSRRRREA